MKLRVQQVDLLEIVSSLAASFESLAARRNIRYTIGRPGGPIVGWFDPDAVEKILTNLLSNAFKYTNDGGTVSLALEVIASGQGDPKPQHVEITVTDSGIGIPSNLLEKIFDRFYQVDDSHTREHEGVGIGLALTKELVELHKGSISVQSEPGRGSTFTVRLPLGKEYFTAEQISGEEGARAGFVRGEAQHEAPQRVEAPATGVESESEDDLTAEAGLLQRLPIVLIVEDNADMRHYIGKHLGESYKLDNAADGTEGLEKAIATVPDLIISDVMMPRMDGFELCRKLKQDERTSHIPIVLLTAKAETGNKIEGLETGADDYLTKPFDVKELAIRVKNLIEQRRKLRERFRSTVVIKPSELAVTSADEKFLTKAMTAVEKHMAESGYDTEAMAEELALSRMQLYRKLRALTGKSPHFFMRTLRLQRAAELLKKKAGNVSEVGYEVGFTNPSNFARAFKEEFGVAPSEYSEKGGKMEFKVGP
jgi:DNA-binding response OmpR family regulator/anti-sigma regulatory factor (Ser/Thr protein kinase)